jgi:NADPH:quinone reductase-like Zn-dependent oxidoreductase
VVPAQTVRVMPAGLDDRVAAAFGVAHRTAYHGLRSVACLESGRNSWCSAPEAASAWRPCRSAR